MQYFDIGHSVKLLADLSFICLCKKIGSTGLAYLGYSLNYVLDDSPECIIFV